MKENYDIPEDLTRDLSEGRRLISSSQGWFDLASSREFKLTSVHIGPFHSKEEGQYYTHALGLVSNTEAYGEYHEALVWLPRLKSYGAWDASHEELHIFPGQTWTTMKTDLLPFIESQWSSSREGKRTFQKRTVHRPNTYPGAFDFIPYRLKDQIKAAFDDEILKLLKRYETSILKHPNLASLTDAYFALANAYHRLGKNEPAEENSWKEKCIRILEYYPKNRFYHEREGAEIWGWASPKKNLLLFRELLNKEDKQPEYSGGASLVSSYLIHSPQEMKPLLELAQDLKHTFAVLRCLYVAKRWALTVVNDRLAARLKGNKTAMLSLDDLIVAVEDRMLSAPESYSESEIHEVRHRRVSDRISKGWEHLRKKEYSKTEECLASVLGEYPENGEALFLDARLVWIRSGSVEEGWKRATENLSKVNRADSSGIGKLHNCIGCALDEIGKFSEAIESFRLAEESDPKESIYPANRAEMFWKLGDEKSASLYARKSKKMGNKSEIVETILKKTAKPSQIRWESFLKEWEKSGLSDKEFCARENLSKKAFAHWRRKTFR
ncbi:IS66 family insertion sequence element accessory protein TnpA [Leptospira barantonii]|uniref:Tetratricopeptide repeat protein n=1 Tax=Leptospira barantonii TaxID=2023184 RepID=A0ABX4NPY2_9LEPT|nr:hypothetical protein [Leptospira barantonii]PJZ57775.1 hypothetical protein CH367_05075 [Leptospira barantonii]